MPAKGLMQRAGSPGDPSEAEHRQGSTEHGRGGRGNLAGDPRTGVQAQRGKATFRRWPSRVVTDPDPLWGRLPSGHKRTALSSHPTLASCQLCEPGQVTCPLGKARATTVWVPGPLRGVSMGSRRGTQVAWTLPASCARIQPRASSRSGSGPTRARLGRGRTLAREGGDRTRQDRPTRPRRGASRSQSLPRSLGLPGAGPDGSPSANSWARRPRWRRCRRRTRA